MWLVGHRSQAVRAGGCREMGSDSTGKARSTARQTEIARIDFFLASLPYICVAMFGYWAYIVFPVLHNPAPMSMLGW